MTKKQVRGCVRFDNFEAWYQATKDLAGAVRLRVMRARVSDFIDERYAQNLVFHGHDVLAGSPGHSEPVNAAIALTPSLILWAPWQPDHGRLPFESLPEAAKVEVVY